MKWTVVKKIQRSNPKNRSYLLCICICGKKSEVRASSFGVDSFGCKVCTSGMRKHGLSNHMLHTRWMAMKQRCYYDGSISRKNYADRGIEICSEWRDDFQRFYDWSMENGFEQNLSLDRIDNDKGYSPDNCRWTTPHEQNRNQRTNIWHEENGKRMILKDWCKYLNLNYDSVRYRIYAGKSVKESLSAKTTTGFKQRIKTKRKKK